MLSPRIQRGEESPIEQKPGEKFVHEIPVFSPLATFAILYGAIAARYLLFSAAFYSLCFSLLGKRRRIAPAAATKEWHEISNSLLASTFFAGAGAWIILAFHGGGTKIYLDWFEFGWLYLPISFFLLVFLHETYFYFTHRWMHWPRIFSAVHLTHHRSKAPTAFASFSFHPWEALIEALILPILVFLIPVHYSVLILFLLFMTLAGTVNHLGYEIFPRRFAGSFLGRWWITPTHHQMHHELVGWNFGLYFTFWDRWLGTEHPDYENRFKQVTENKREEEKEPPEFDLLIVGGGLSGGLVAYHLKQTRPNWNVLLIEKGETLGGTHTWSFHGSDLSEAIWKWMSPLVSKSWENHELHFPSLKRLMTSSYHSIRSEDFHQRILSAGVKTLFKSSVFQIEEDSVTLEDGTKIYAKAALDARGIGKITSLCAYQKFLGLDLELEHPHGLKNPVLMDATVPQLEGYRFIYLLPWSETKLLVEDTRYSSFPEINDNEFEKSIMAYCREKKWGVKNIIRREKGCLPIPLEAFPREKSAIGMRGALLHDTTGYTLPDSARIAELIGKMLELNAEALEKNIHRYFLRKRLGRAFLRALNRMLFLGSAPEKRIKVFEKFYRLPSSTIQNFYSGSLKPLDAARILSGKPPLPWYLGVKAIFSSSCKGTEP